MLGSETLKNPQIKNLYDWCNKQLVSDYVKPNCTLEASAKESSIDNIPVSIKNNYLEADLSILNYNTKYTINIVESKSSNARSELFEITKVKREEEKIVKLNTTFLSEYFCLNFGGKVDTEENLSRDFSFKTYHYFPKFELPHPIPSNMSESIVCHDETKYGKGDDALYPRLGLVNDRISMFDKTDPMFIYENQRTKVSNKIIQAMLEKTGTAVVGEFFQKLNTSTDPLNFSTMSGFYTIPFVDTNSNIAKCPNGNSNLEIEIQKYTGKTEGLYLGQAQQSTPNESKIANVYLTETNLINFGFYLENGVKRKVQDSSELNNRSIFLYYPFNKNIDPLTKSDRILFTIVDQLFSSAVTSDKRIGCISVKSAESSVGKWPGENCQSDYECHSLCCDNRIGACKSHDEKNMFCEKQPGEMCITSIFCEKAYVPVCSLYKSGTRADGKISCQVRCEQELKYGDCVNGLCNASNGQTDTSNFDLENCTGAIEP